jgi:hypothetical protein
MKKFLIILSLFFSITVFAGNPTVVLHFDLNGTILAKDPAAGKDQKAMINSILAKETSGIWDDTWQKQLMSYDDYLHHIEGQLVQHITDPRLKRTEGKKARSEKSSRFVEDFDVRFQGELSEKMKLLDQRVSSFDKEIFDSLFFLLEHLKQKQIQYRLVLRTFGNDLDQVVAALEGKLNTRFVRGTFKTDPVTKQSVLKVRYFHGIEETVTNFKRMEEVLNGTPFLAIQDDYGPWGNAPIKEDWHFGKPFFYASAEKDVLPVFFDDNVGEPNSPSGIVRPINLVTGEAVDPTPLLDKQIFKVQTSRAIGLGAPGTLNSYYIDLVEKALEFRVQ